MNDTAAFPVTYDVEPQLTGRNRLTSAFRIILAIPHLILVGGPGLGISLGAPLFYAFGDDGNDWSGFGGAGVIGFVIGIVAIISWFAILFTGKMPRGLWDFANFFFRWRSKAIAYTALLRDEYPPFGDGEYPVRYAAEYPETRNRVSVLFRLFLLIPHYIVLFFVGIAAAVALIIAWFAILFTGSFPEGLYNFVVGYLRWSLRVETYGYLMHDEFPPFSLGVSTPRIATDPATP